MECWLKPVAAVTAPDPVKDDAKLVAVKAEMAKVWDEYATMDDMMKHVENWLVGSHVAGKENPGCHGIAPVGVRGCLLREQLYPVMLEVYREKHPEDFEAKLVGAVDVGEIIKPK